ncbi:MAG: glutathione S-transferase family protein [Alphaproteobacteria bacterium]|nr:glutathione S-transferase family protein [Alphaproteobacteria bacterium]
MMLKVWGRDTSINVQKVLWALDELSLPYERIDAGGAFGGLDTPEYATLNPNRKIPVLEDGDYSVWESGAIIQYLADAYGAGRLWPENVKQRALVSQWARWCHINVYSDLIVGAFQPLIRVTAAERDDAAVAAAAGRVGKSFEILDPALHGHDFLVGNQLSVADIEIGTLLHRYFTMPIGRPDLPNVAAWYERLSTRPAYRKHVMQDWTLMKIPGA